MKHKTIPEARARLAAALPSTTETLRGSLLHRHILERICELNQQLLRTEKKA